MATDIIALGIAAGANARATQIGTFTSLPSTTILTGRDIIQTSGRSASGDGGHGLHRYDATVNAAYAAANPRIAALDATGRGFKLVEAPTALTTGSSVRADLRADEVEVGSMAPRKLLDYFTPVQDRAILTGDYSAITTVPQKQDFQNRLQLAIDSAENRTLIFPQTHFIRVYAPITIWGLSRIVSEAQGWSAHAVIFQDGTVDWQALYPGYALFNTVNYNWPKRYAGAGFPAFWGGGTIDGLYFQGDFDPVAAANPARIADGGLMVWSPNERVRVNAVGDRFALYGVAIGGTSSVLKGSEIGGFYNGAAQDTRWGHAVTRTASAFGAAVYVRRTNSVSSTTVQLEAAAATDLDTIIAGDVLTFSRTNKSIQDGSTEVAWQNCTGR